MKKQRRIDAQLADSELLQVLEDMLNQDIKITIRECVRRMKLVNAPSSISRSNTRMEIVKKYIKKQEHIRSVSKKVVKLSIKQMETKILSLEASVIVLKERETGLLQTLDALFVAALSQGVDVSKMYNDYLSEK